MASCPQPPGVFGLFHLGEGQERQVEETLAPATGTRVAYLPPSTVTPPLLLGARTPQAPQDPPGPSRPPQPSQTPGPPRPETEGFLQGLDAVPHSLVSS